MPAIITNKFRFYNAYQFMENFKDVPVQDSAADGDPDIGLSRSKFYLFVGKSTPWEGGDADGDGYLQPRLTTSQHNGSTAGSIYPFNPQAGLPGPQASQYDLGSEIADAASDTNPPSPYDTVSNEMSTWDEILAAKGIGSADVSFVIPRYNWVSGETYAAYDDADTYLFEKPFYVINRDYRVYKCIDNNGNSPVYDEPAEVKTDGYISTSDGYVWKLMYSISPADVVKFVTPEWIPVQTVYNYDEKAANVYQSEQSSIQTAANDGDVTRLMSVSNPGDALANGSYKVVGDGNEVAATQANGQISGITSTPIGGGASAFRGDVSVVNAADDSAVAGSRAVVSPRGGHGFDAVKELGGFYVMVNTRLEYDQSGKVFVDNDFRKIGLVVDPLKGTSDHTSYGLATGADQSGGLISIVDDGTVQRYDNQVVPAGYYPGVAVFASGGSQVSTNGTADVQVDANGDIITASITVRNAGSGYTIDDQVTFAVPSERATAVAQSAGNGITTPGVYKVASVLPAGTGDARLLPGDAFTDAIADQRAKVEFDTALTDDEWDKLELGVDGLVDFPVTSDAGASATVLNSVRPADIASGAGVVYLSGVTGSIAAGDTLTINDNSGNLIKSVNVTSFTEAALKHDSGDILYVEHRRPIVRASDQIEDIKLIIEF